jgi:DNA-binding MarR family transcriptional regulator
MSKATKNGREPAGNPTSRPPFIGALLRLAYQIARQHQLRRLQKHGFGDLNQALLNLMVYPHPDGVRPTDLAERVNMTRQATNYLIGQLEALGYLERRVRKDGNRRLVYLTRRGWESIDCHRTAMLELEKQWAKAIGQKRFDDFKKTVAELVALEMNSAEETTEFTHQR